MGSVLLLTLSLVATFIAGGLSQLDFSAIGNPNVKYTGDGTFYGQQPGQNDAGACSYGKNNANSLGYEWSTGVDTFIALNQAQFNSSVACGTCIMYRGLGDSPKCKSPIGEKTCGTTPIQSEWKMGLVDNQCPECSYGDIDLNLDGNGRWLQEWYAVPCNVGNGTIVYSITGQNPYWFMFVISNTRVPVKSVETPGGDGVFYNLRRGYNNAWAANGGPFTFPVKLRITSVLDDVVEDWLPSGGGRGTAQFPPLKTASTSAAVSAPAASFPTKTSIKPLVSAFAGPPEEANGTTPFPAPAPLSYQPFTVVKGGQCGGKLGFCTELGNEECKDAQWDGASCTSGTTCERYDETWWECKSADVSAAGRRLLKA